MLKFYQKSLILNIKSQFNFIQCNNFSSIHSRRMMIEKIHKKDKLRNQEKTESQKSQKDENKKSEKDEKEIAIKDRVFSSPAAALGEMKKIPQRFPNQTIDMVVALNVDVKRGDQVVRGIYKMPGGSNKIPKLMVFTSPQYAELAIKAGADMIADTQTYKDISEGKIDFDKCVCTLDTLPSLKNLGRILGPKGLMPSSKVGTACIGDNLEKIIKELKMGSREFKTDIWGQIQVPIGKKDFNDENVLQNIDSFMKVLLEKKPDVIKGRYFLYAYLNTYKHSFRIDMRSLDPKSTNYFMNL